MCEWARARLDFAVRMGYIQCQCELLFIISWKQRRSFRLECRRRYADIREFNAWRARISFMSIEQASMPATHAHTLCSLSQCRKYYYRRSGRFFVHEQDTGYTLHRHPVLQTNDERNRSSFGWDVNEWRMPVRLCKLLSLLRMPLRSLSEKARESESPKCDRTTVECVSQ